MRNVRGPTRTPTPQKSACGTRGQALIRFVLGSAARIAVTQVVSSLADLIADEFRSGRPVALFGDGATRRSNVWNRGLAELVLRLGLASREHSVYNVCSEQYYSGAQVVQVEAAAVGLRPRVRRAPPARRRPLPAARTTRDLRLCNPTAGSVHHTDRGDTSAISRHGCSLGPRVKQRRQNSPRSSGDSGSNAKSSPRSVGC